MPYRWCTRWRRQRFFQALDSNIWCLLHYFLDYLNIFFSLLEFKQVCHHILRMAYESNTCMRKTAPHWQCDSHCGTNKELSLLRSRTSNICTTKQNCKNNDWFPKYLPCLPLVGKSVSLAPKWCHWLSQWSNLKQLYRNWESDTS